MRGSSLARVAMVGLGVSVVISLGCDGSPTQPSKMEHLSWVSISPNAGASVAATVVRIGGMHFLSGTTVTVGGSRVDATVVNTNTISLVMPAHAAGNVDVTVTRSGLAPVNVPGGFTYIGPPVISELFPNTGSTDGGTPLTIRGAGKGGMGSVVSVTVDGIVSKFDSDWPYNAELYLSTPAHAAGTVEVIVTDQYGQSGSGTFTYASPATFDFNGDWKGWAENQSESVLLWLTIRDNVVVSLSCGQRQDGSDARSVTLDPPPVVADSAFSFAGSGGVSITGKIVSPNIASGSINTASCVSAGQWRAEKK